MTSPAPTPATAVHDDPPADQSSSARRRRLWVLCATPLFALVFLELSLRVAHDGFGLFRGWLYMRAQATDYDACSSVRELFEAVGEQWAPCTISNDFVLNSRGFRTGEYEEHKPPGVRRIVVLGDSHSWASGGMPYRSLWHRQLAAGIKQRTYERFQVLSLAVSAVGPTFEERMWQVEGRKLDADLVILALSVGNDFEDLSRELADQTALDRWARRVYVVRLVRNALRLSGANAGSLAYGSVRELAPPELAGSIRPGVEAVYDRTAPQLSVDAHERLLRNQAYITDRREGPAGDFELAFGRVTAILARLDADVRARGGRFVVLALPAEYQLDAAPLQRALAREQLALDAFDLERPQRRLKEWCASSGVLCVDTLPELRRRSDLGPLFNVRESHLNDLAHEVIAELLLAELVAAGLIP